MDVKLLTYVSIEAGRALRSLRMIQTESGYAARNMGTFADQTQKAGLNARAMGQGLNTLAGGARIVAGSIMTAAGAFATFGALSSKAFMDVETPMLRVKAVTKATEGQYLDLTDAALKAARATGIAASKQAEGQGFMAMAGFGAGDIKKAMPGVTALATIGQMDFASSADIVTNILTGMGMEVGQLDIAVQAMVNTFTNSNTNIRQMGDAFKYAGPVAKQAGVDVSELSAAVGLLGNAGIQGEMAGTALRNMMLRLLNPTSRMQKIQKSLGLEFKDNHGNMKTYVQILQELERVDVSQKDLAALFGTRAMPSVIALLDQGSEALHRFSEENRNAKGAGDMMTEMLDSFESKLGMAKAVLLEVAGAAGGVFKDGFVEASKAINLSSGDITNLKKTAMDFALGGLNAMVEGSVFFAKALITVSTAGNGFIDVMDIITDTIAILIGGFARGAFFGVQMFEELMFGARAFHVALLEQSAKFLPMGENNPTLKGPLAEAREAEAIAKRNSDNAEKYGRELKARQRQLATNRADTFARLGKNVEGDAARKSLDDFIVGWRKGQETIKEGIGTKDIFNRMKDDMDSMKGAFPGAGDAHLAILVRANYDDSFKDVAQQIREDLGNGITMSAKDSLDQLGAYHQALKDTFIGPYLAAENEIKKIKTRTYTGAGGEADLSKDVANKLEKVMAKARKEAAKAQKKADDAAIKQAENTAKAIVSAQDMIQKAREKAAEAAEREAQATLDSMKRLQDGVRDMMFSGFSDAIRPEIVGEQVARMNLELQMATMTLEEQQIALAERHNAVLERRLDGLKGLTDGTHAMATGYYNMQVAIESAESAEAKKNLTALQGVQIASQLPALAGQMAKAMGASTEEQIIVQMALNAILGVTALIMGLTTYNPSMLAAAAVAGVSLVGGAASLAAGASARPTFAGAQSTAAEDADRKASTTEAINDALKAAGLWQQETRDQTMNFYGGDPLEYRQPLRASSDTIRQNRRAGRLRL